MKAEISVKDTRFHRGKYKIVIWYIHMFSELTLENEYSSIVVLYLISRKFRGYARGIFPERMVKIN